MHTATRRRLPTDRVGLAHDFNLAGHHVHIRTGEYEDGTLGEVFIEVDKAGSTMSGLLDGFATAISLAIQYGTPLSVLADKFIGSSFPPMGITGSADVPLATSMLDLVFRWLRDRYE